MSLYALNSGTRIPGSNDGQGNRPGSIYQFSNMAPRLSGQNFFLVSFVSQFPKETWIQSLS